MQYYSSRILIYRTYKVLCLFTVPIKKGVAILRCAMQFQCCVATFPGIGWHDKIWLTAVEGAIVYPYVFLFLLQAPCRQRLLGVSRSQYTACSTFPLGALSFLLVRTMPQTIGRAINTIIKLLPTLTLFITQLSYEYLY